LTPASHISKSIPIAVQIKLVIRAGNSIFSNRSGQRLYKNVIEFITSITETILTASTIGTRLIVPISPSNINESANPVTL
jgi:hypothetical protein